MPTRKELIVGVGINWTPYYISRSNIGQVTLEDVRVIMSSTVAGFVARRPRSNGAENVLFRNAMGVEYAI